MAKKIADKTGDKSVVSSDFTARLGKLTGAAKAVKAPAPDVMERALGEGVDLGPMGVLRWVPLGELDDSPFQTREDISDDHIRSLVESLDGRGLIEIPPARLGQNGRVQIGAGHCRTEAVRLGANAGSQLPDPDRFLGKMLFLIKERDDLEMAAIGVDENVVRENPNPIELARGYRNLKAVLENAGLPDDATWDVIAQRAKISTRRVHQLVRLFELPDLARKRIAEGTWNEKHGRAILGAAKEHRELLMRQMMREDLSGNRAIERASSLSKTHPTQGQKRLIEIADEAIKSEVKRKARAGGQKSAAELKKIGAEDPAENDNDTGSKNGDRPAANESVNSNGITIGRSVAGASPLENHLRTALHGLEIAAVAVEMSGAKEKEGWAKRLLDIGDEIEEAARLERGGDALR